jgi:hypothetical protein
MLQTIYPVLEILLSTDVVQDTEHTSNQSQHVAKPKTQYSDILGQQNINFNKQASYNQQPSHFHYREN